MTRTTRLMVCVALFLGLSTVLCAQSLGKFNPEENRGARGPRKFTSKDVYIANFSVNYQLYNLRTSTTKGGLGSRMLSGNTKASLAVGLDIPVNTLQELTDDAYRQFVQDLESKGFNVLNGDAAANTGYYEGYQRFESMEMSLAEAPGVVTVYPQNTVFFVKGFTSGGQKKQGGFLGSIDRVTGDAHNARADEIRTYPKLSAELDDATIVNVDLYVLFLNDEKAYQGNGAKVTATTNLCLSANEHITGRVANNSTTTKLGLTGSTKEQTFQCVSSIDFIQGRNKIGGSPLGTYCGVLKKDLNITGVIGKEKIQSYAKTDHDFIGTETAFGKMYRADNISVENTALIKADAAKYENGVNQALNTFLSHHVNEFKTKFF
ncbi:hypothetical protein SAMN05444274_108116 [Mariniphaga anaerophila]|uniref:Uncharacterized protein n=1 Tax=Mariniphaga anaerophila TaxID=1484053 RepID=A0A1M5E7A8_9BACT|nr:hypothetical protein [Mariniphaga anaerophila]SHF75143.1 hypothetical protein SAMN05444274_108116 [Mariniphaga anaerophila]